MKEKKIDITRVDKVPYKFTWCGEEYGYGLFDNEKPKQVALRVIRNVFLNKDVSDIKFVYIVHKYTGHQSKQDILDVYYYKNWNL